MVMTGGMESSPTTISGPAIETALYITGVFEEQEGRKICDRVKRLGREISKQITAERARQREAANG